MNNKVTLKPFDNFEALDGYHCQSNSLAKMYAFHNALLSEEMLLGLGAGVGFIYWHQKGTLPFLGGRGNNKNYHLDVGSRTGVEIQKFETASKAKAEKTLLESLEQQRPVMMFVDMGFLPCFDFGDDYHFGGHTHVVCGFDGQNKILVSDMAAADVGLKQGFVYEMTLEELAIARGSKFKPFPPKNGYFSFDFSGFRSPSSEDTLESIRQTADQILHPPIKNFGTQGIRKAGREIKKWEAQLNDEDFRMSLFNIYLFVSVAGTGDGLFRYMYGRFLEEAAGITGNRSLSEIGSLVKTCGDMWVNLGIPFKEALTAENPASLLTDVTDRLNEIADKEDEAFTQLADLAN